MTSLRVLTTLFVCLLLPGSAAAQDKPEEPGKQEKIDPARAKEASDAFKEGQRLFDGADYLGAIDSFQKAYELRPHFLVQCNIALCHERQNDMIKAAEHYKRCLSEGADKTEKGETVKNSLERVEGRITWLKVDSQGAGGTIYVDGRRVGPAPARVPLNPGSHVVEVRRKGTIAATTTISTRGGEEKQVELTPTRAEDGSKKVVSKSRRRLHQAYFWSAAGLTVVFALVATITGVQTLGIHDDYEDNPSQELLDRGTNRRLVTNIMWAGAAVAAGSATALYFFSDLPWTRERGQDNKHAATLGIGLRGTF
jgi:hypothetical protein